MRKSKRISKSLDPKVKFRFPYVINLSIYTSSTFSHLKKKQIRIFNALTENIEKFCFENFNFLMWLRHTFTFKKKDKFVYLSENMEKFWFENFNSLIRLVPLFRNIYNFRVRSIYMVDRKSERIARSLVPRIKVPCMISNSGNGKSTQSCT